MALTATQFMLLCAVGIILLARPAHAFGAGNIGSTSKIEGENWRHGDLEDTLLTLVASKAMGGKKFGKLDVKRVYFGNWLRDYSQAVDVGTVKYVSAEAIRLLLWILGFMSFGYGTKEFEVTTERLGCYRPEEHIDNPKDYADNEDARQYDRRLRGPVDERRELAIDPVTGLKAYIASENLGIDTSAALVRKLFGRSIELGRRYARNKNKADLHEALRLLGTGCHCLEDFSAHSNYTELVLIELGEQDVFPHVGRNCHTRLRGARSPVYPLVTGTFGGVDFLHSVTGEFDDKVTQSEIQELEGTLQQAQNQQQSNSQLQELLKKLPDGLFGGKDEAQQADDLKTNATQHQMQNTQITPREPEEWLQYVNDARDQIYPIIQWHDEIMQGITETIENIPILPNLVEEIQEQVNIFVFSLIAPFMLPIISQIKNELNTGSSAIIQSSVEKQHIVFSDDDCSDPTHSMLSKDHFSNVLNEPAGKVAGQVLRWVVPQLIAAWDDDNVDIDRTLNRIIRGVFHHPALRDQGEDGASDGRQKMFSVVEKWWGEKSQREKNSLRDQLSREGVEEGRNHKPGVKDHGHGSAKKLGMPNVYTANHQGAPGGFGDASGLPPGMAAQAHQQISSTVGDAVGGGVLGSLVGGLAGAVGTGVLAGAASGFGGDNDNDATQNYNSTSYGGDNRRAQNTGQFGGRPGSGNYGQSQISQNQGGYSGRSQQHSTSTGGGYNSESRTQQSSYGGGYSSESRRYESSNTTSYGRREEETSSYGSSGFGGGRVNQNQSERIPGGFGSQQASSYGRQDDDERVSGGYRSQQTQSYGRRNDEDERPSHGRRDDDDDENQRRIPGRRRDDDDDGRPSYGAGGRQNDYEQPAYGGGRRHDDDDNERSSHGRRRGDDDDDNERRSGYGQSGAFGQSRQQESSYGRNTYDRQEQETSFGSGGGYGRQQEQEGFGSGNYGGSGRRGVDTDNDMPGGFGGDDNENRRGEGYGNRRRRGSNDRDEDEGGYGGGRRHGGY